MNLLLVTDLPIIFPVKPNTRIVKEFGRIWKNAGKVVARCSSVGHPQPKFKRRKHLSNLPSSAVVSNGGKTLTLNRLNVVDTGTYVCSVSNELGSSEIATFLHVYPEGKDKNIYQRFLLSIATGNLVLRRILRINYMPTVSITIDDYAKDGRPVVG